MTLRPLAAARHIGVPLLLYAMTLAPLFPAHCQYPANTVPSLEDMEKLEGLIGKAETNLRKGEFAAASKSAKTILDLDPGNALALSIRAESLNWLGRYTEAERDALRAVEIDQESGRVWRNAAWSELGLGKMKEALEAAAKAASLEPGNADSRALLAYAAEASGDAASALEEMAKAAEIDQKYSEKLSAAHAGKPMREVNADGWALFLDRRPKPSRAPPWKWIIAAAGAAAFVRALTLGRGKAKGAGSREVERAQAPEAPKEAPSSEGSSSPPPKRVDADSALPRVGEKYRLGRLLGRGSFGEVFEAQESSGGRPVAIKRLAGPCIGLEPEGCARAVREAAAYAALEHPALAQLYEAFEDRGDLLLVFEFAQGTPLRRLLAEGQRFTAAKALEILRSVCEALDAAHALGKAHLDVKPSNILVSGPQVKLTDFGVAPALRTAMPESSLPYSAPELQAGEPCARSDVYSLGAVLYEMLTGSAPFPPPAGRPQKMNMDFTPPSLRVRGLPARLDDLMQKALVPYPANRLRTPGALLKALRAL